MDKLVTISLLEEKLQQNDFASARVLYDSLPDSIEKADAAYKLIEAYCSAVVSENLDGVSQTQANHRILAIEVYNSMAESSTELILKKADAACYMVEGCISYHALYVKDTVIGDDFVCNHIAPACAIYDSMPEDSTATKVFAACQLITAYCMAGDLASARALYDSIVDIQIDDMSSLIARRAYYSEKPRTTADLLCAYYYAGDLASANELYSSMPDSPEKSKIAYHVIGNFTDSDNFDFARELFDSMPISGTTDESTELIAETKRDTAWLLMSSYCIAGNIAAACAMYDSMPYSDEFAEIKGETAHLLIGQYADTSMIESARALYDSMPEDSASLILAKANATSALISAYGDIG
ncbi:MAG: hypothetical protein LBV04_03775, partial [Deferribacteraceae bacterium]|nr:hypothetical protein [Deferribacteraceae bacterium]